MVGVMSITLSTKARGRSERDEDDSECSSVASPSEGDMGGVTTSEAELRRKLLWLRLRMLLLEGRGGVGVWEVVPREAAELADVWEFVFESSCWWIAKSSSSFM